MLIIDRIRDAVRILSRQRPLLYYGYFILLIAGIAYNCVGALVVFSKAGAAALILDQIVAALFLVLFIPEALMLYFYARRREAAVDFLDISFAAAALLHLAIGHFGAVIVVAILWFVVSDFIRFKEQGHDYLFM